MKVYLNFYQLFFQDRCSHPQARSGHRIIANNQYIYCFGGFNPSISPNDPYYSTDPVWRSTKPLFQELWRFSKLTQTWCRLPIHGTIPRELVSHCIAWWDQHTILVYGGSGFPFGATSSNSLYTCDLRTNLWTRVYHCINDINFDDTCIPMSGFGQAMTVDKKKNCFYICGGTNGNDYNMDVHRFDMKTKQWVRLAFTPETVHARYRHEMALWNNRLYIIGGGTSTARFSTEFVSV